LAGGPGHGAVKRGLVLGWSGGEGGRVGGA